MVGAVHGVPRGPLAPVVAVLAARQRRHAHVVGAPERAAQPADADAHAARVVPLLAAGGVRALVVLAEEPAAGRVGARRGARRVQRAAVVAARGGAEPVDARRRAPLRRVRRRHAEVLVAEARGAVRRVEEDEGVAAGRLAHLVPVAVDRGVVEWGVWGGGVRGGGGAGGRRGVHAVAAPRVVARVPLAAQPGAGPRLLAVPDAAAVPGAVRRGLSGARFSAVSVDAAICIR